MSHGLRITQLLNSPDHRGDSFQVPLQCLEFIPRLGDFHIATIKPSSIRGNHFHRDRREILCVVFKDQWSLHWDTGHGTDVKRATFSGSGVVVVEIEPHISHAVRNDGGSTIQVIGLSNLPYSTMTPDSVKRIVV